MIRFGELDGQRSAQSNRLAEALSQAGIEFDHTENIIAALWSKFVFVVGSERAECAHPSVHRPDPGRC